MTLEQQKAIALASARARMAQAQAQSQPTVEEPTVEEPSLLKKTLSLPVAIPEAAMNMVSGMVAKPISDLAGLGGVLAGATGLRKNVDPAAEQEAVRKALTYQPRTAAGKVATDLNPLALAGEYIIHPAAQAVGEFTSGISDDEGTQKIIQSGVGETVEQALGFAGVKGLRAKPKQYAPKTDIVKKTAIKNGLDLGLKASPTERGAGAVMKQTEDFAGGARVQHDIALKNRPVINAKVREQLSLPKEAPLTDNTYRKAISNEYAPYVEAKSLGQMNVAKTGNPPKLKDSSVVVEQIKQLRHDGNMYTASGAIKKSPKKIALGRKMLAKAERLDTALDAHATAVGKPDLVPALHEARKNIAVIYNAKNATKGGDVVASKLTQQLEKGVPLSGEMKTIAEFNQHAEGSMRRPKAGGAALESPGILTAIPRWVAKQIAYKASTGNNPIPKGTFKKAASTAAVIEALRNREQEDATQ